MPAAYEEKEKRGEEKNMTKATDINHNLKTGDRVIFYTSNNLLIADEDIESAINSNEIKIDIAKGIIKNIYGYIVIIELENKKGLGISNGFHNIGVHYKQCRKLVKKKR